MLLSGLSMGQNYYCPASGVGSTVLKFDQWIQVADSIVKLKTGYKERLDSAIYKRLISSSGTNVYFTDGVMTTTLTVVNQTGSVKGFKYTHVITMRLDPKQASGSTILYCTVSK